VVAAVEEADAAATGSRAVPRGHPSVTALLLFGVMFITPIVIDHLERLPEVDVLRWLVDRAVKLVEEGVAPALRIGELPDPSLQAVRAGQVWRVIRASPGYLARAGLPVIPDGLAQHRIVSAGAVTPSPDSRLNGGTSPRGQAATAPDHHQQRRRGRRGARRLGHDKAAVVPGRQTHGASAA
jgi:DNA-binding transcriptional LysR family regulator